MTGAAAFFASAAVALAILRITVGRPAARRRAERAYRSEYVSTADEGQWWVA